MMATSVLEHKDQESFIDLLVKSGRLLSPSSREAFLRRIDYPVGSMDFASSGAEDFARNLIGRLKDSNNWDCLQKIAQAIAKDIHASGKIELERIRAALNRIPSIESAWNEKEPPRPYDSLEKTAPPHEMPAFPLETTTFRSIPFDLGTCWGLDRGNYIGILAGFEQDGVYEGLVNVERALYDLMSDLAEPVPLPIRWWIRIDPFSFPNGPRSPDDVWKSAKDTDNVLSMYLSAHGLKDFIIPGIFVDVDASEFGQSTITCLRSWCKALLERVFPSVETAIIIHINGKTPDESRKTAIDVRYHLTVMHQTSIQTMILDDWVIGSDLPTAPKLTLPHSREEPELYLYSWLSDAFKAAIAAIGCEDDLLKVYEPLIRIFWKLKERFGERYQGAYARQVVDELDRAVASNAEYMGDYIDQLLLQITREYLPERINALIKAYPRSNRSIARRQALTFASQSNALMDAWVAGSDLDPEHPPSTADLIALPCEGAVREPLLDQLVLGMLRKYHREKYPENIRKSIEKLMQFMNPDLIAVCVFCFGEMDEVTLLSKYSAREFELAIRAGAGPRFHLDELPNSLIANPDQCWLLTSLPVTESRIRRLLRLPLSQRAIFGLCTAQEREEIEKNQEVLSQIIECRRNRPIS